MNPQYKKGVLELCVLSLLRKQDRYGYEISDYLSRHIDIADGTVYPLLREMKADGLVTTYLQEESGGPPRKYYKLTQLGEDEDEDAPQRRPGSKALTVVGLVLADVFAGLFFLLLVGFGVVLVYVVCALSAGSFQFWHVWAGSGTAGNKTVRQKPVAHSVPHRKAFMASQRIIRINKESPGSLAITRFPGFGAEGGI